MFAKLEPKHAYIDTKEWSELIMSGDAFLENVEEERRPFVRACMGQYDTEDILYLFRLGESEYNSIIMDCCLMIGTPIGVISTVTGTPEIIVEMYSKYFFDACVFMGNRVFKMEYINTLPEEELQDKARKEMFLMTWKTGLNYIKYTLGLRDDIDVPSHIKDLFLVAYYQTHIHALIPWRYDSDISTNWSKQSATLANLAEKKQSPFDMEHLRTKLTSEEFREDKYPDEEYFS